MVLKDLLKVLNNKQLLKIVCSDLSSGYLEMYVDDAKQMLNAFVLYRWVKSVKVGGTRELPILQVVITNKFSEVQNNDC